MCENSLPDHEGWYSLVGDAGTKMPTTHVPSLRCGTNWSGWLKTAHHAVEDRVVYRTVYFSNRVNSCKYSAKIFEKSVDPTSSTSFFIHLVVIRITVLQT